MVFPFQKRSDQSFSRMGKLGPEEVGEGGSGHCGIGVKDSELRFAGSLGLLTLSMYSPQVTATWADSLSPAHGTRAFSIFLLRRQPLSPTPDTPAVLNLF